MKYNVICQNCGKEYSVQLFGKNSNRMYILGIKDEDELPVKYGTCEKCEEKQENGWIQKNNEKNINSELPKLSGTEKQIAWAISIRDTEIPKIIEKIERYSKMESSLAKKIILKMKWKLDIFQNSKESSEIIETKTGENSYENSR